MLKVPFPPTTARTLWRYGVAVVSVLIALLLKLLIESAGPETTPFLLFFSAVMVSAWYGGLRPGVVATVLAAVISDYFVLGPGHFFSGHTSAQHLRLALFVLEGLLISGLCEAMHAATRRAEARKLDVLRSEESLRRTQQELADLLGREQHAREQAEAANRIKDEFLATMSHELRTPLNAMLGWAQMLRSGKLDEAGHDRAIETIEQSAKSQAKLIEDLLDVSRIMSGKMRLDVRSVDLAPVIEAAVDTVRPAAEAKEISVQCMLQRGTALVSGDANRLQQVVWNLLSNAIKFTRRGGVVQVELQRLDSNADITVQDTGVGIPANFLPYIFDRFRQADSSSARSHGGLGLGLAIVRHLVELHGGTVRAESPGQGKGTTVRVSLPLAPLLVKARDRAGARVAKAGDAPIKPTPALRGLRVLVVEDDPPSREMISNMLSLCGVRVTAVASAAEALAAMQRQRPDVLLSDIEMPDEDGYSLIRQVRALEPDAGGRTPAAALTAYARAEDRRRALAAGYQKHIAKPVDPAELASVIADLAGQPASA